MLRGSPLLAAILSLVAGCSDDHLSSPDAAGPATDLGTSDGQSSSPARVTCSTEADCPGPFPPCGTSVCIGGYCHVAPPDRDADGHGDRDCTVEDALFLDDDCDDADPRRFPGNVEICDGHDEDCSLTTFGSTDEDGDGEVSAACCNEDEGETFCATDCDDHDPSVGFRAMERCNGRDDDCDFEVDEECTDAGADDAGADAAPFDGGSAIDGGVDMDGGPGDAALSDGAMDSGSDSGCVASVPPDEVCNRRDDDCDGRVDEGCEIVGIYAGDFHTGAVRQNGTAIDWGYNRGVRAVDGIVNAGLITEGDGHRCMVTADRHALCRGANNYGQLGNGRTDTVPESDFVEVMSLSDPLSMSAGADFTCATAGFSIPYCWGRNDDGRLGIGSYEMRTTPTRVSGLSYASTIVAGGEHACALVASAMTAEVWCWGSNDMGQLGADPATVPNSNVPLRVPGIDDAGALCVSYGHTCTIRRSGRVWCWGNNFDGQLGDGMDATRSFVPVESLAPGVFTQLTCGADGTCGVRLDGSVWCWGRNDFGQAGNGTFDEPALPGEVLGIESPPVQLVYGGWHGCVLMDSGSVACWGYNGDAQLGDGTRENRSSAVLVVGVP